MLLIKIILSLISAAISAVLYRAGGMSKDSEAEPKWIPVWMRQSWMRDWVIPFFSIGTLLIWWQPAESWGYWLIIPSWAMMGGAFSTYWDEVPFNEGADNYFMHGFFIGLSIFPFCFCGLSWLILLYQVLISALAMGTWSAIVGKDYVEEMGRGFVATIVRTIHG